jgi:P4 family phage/plasmid primase-like protien
MGWTSTGGKFGMEIQQNDLRELIDLIKQDNALSNDFVAETAQVKQKPKKYNDKPWLYYDEGNKRTIVLKPILAEHIRKNSYYKFVRNVATDGVLMYWYKNGVYQLINDAELKSYIKGFIPVPLQKMRDINEVHGFLTTDNQFVSHDTMNSDENIINFKNGLLHLDTMKLTSHTPEIFSTIQIPCNWNPNAKPSNDNHFEKYIEHLTTGDREVRSLLLQFMGVAISNIKGWRMKKALFMVGLGDTGKSQLRELTNRLIGVENVSGIDLESLEARFGTSTVFNKRIVGSADMSYATIKELKSFKQLTGGDTISAEFKGRNAFNFKYDGLVWFCCNELPKFGGDRGDWVYNRIMVCECNNPVLKMDKHLQDKMFTEREYIVTLAIKELQKVIDNDYEFIIPDCMKQATEQYKVDNDSFLQFLDECTTPRLNGKIYDDCDKKRFYEVYKAWCDDYNKGYFETKKQVKEKLSAKKLDETVKVNGTHYYKHFTLTLETKTEYRHVYGVDSTYKKANLCFGEKNY